MRPALPYYHSQMKDIERKEKLEALSCPAHPLIPCHASPGRLEASQVDLLLLVSLEIIVHSTN